MKAGWIQINSEEDLPEEGKYVLARHNRDTWRDSTDQPNVNCIVVKLKRGLSMNDRETLLENDERKNQYYWGDEHSNNLVPYRWQQFGSNDFFGQEITEYILIPD